MEQSNRSRIQEIFLEALELPESERSAFVAKQCAGESDCIRDVSALLEAAARPGILDNPVANLGSGSMSLDGLDPRYEIKRELSRGGMSRVYLALDRRLHNKPVVIKVLSQLLVQNAFARQHFDQEVEALLRLQDPHVVDVTDRGDLADGRAYIVMEYVDGDSLRSQIRNEGMVLKRAAFILSQVGAALEHAHQNGIFHRDVKPENIMLRRGTDSVVLIDFGIAKVTDSVVAPSTVNGASAGTLPYMSPEQLRGETVTAASDIYSMAVVAFEMITGRKPFAPSSAAHMLQLQREGVRPRPTDLRPDLPKKAERIILRALLFEARYRYRSAKQFGDELAEALNKQSGPKPVSHLMRLLVVCAAAVILALLSYGIYKYIVRSEPPARPQIQSLASTSIGFNYWLIVQKTRDGKDYQEPTKSNGRDDVFENGDKFQLNVFTLEAGYLYIFNEGPPEPNTATFRMLYPKKVINSGSASVGRNHTVQSDWITFRGPAGTENFWIVWSASPISELEFARTEALGHPQAGLIDQNLVKTREFLQITQAKLNVRIRRYESNQQATVRGNDDPVLTFVQFKHH